MERYEMQRIVRRKKTSSEQGVDVEDDIVRVQDLPDGIIDLIIGYSRPEGTLRGQRLFRYGKDAFTLAQTCVNFALKVSNHAPRIHTIDNLYPMQLSDEACNLGVKPTAAMIKKLIEYAGNYLKVLRLRPRETLADMMPLLSAYCTNLEELEFEDDFNVILDMDLRYFTLESALRRIHVYRPNTFLHVLDQMSGLESIALTGIDLDQVETLCGVVRKFTATLRHLELAFSFCTGLLENWAGSFSPLAYAIVEEMGGLQALESLFFEVRCRMGINRCEICYRGDQSCFLILTDDIPFRLQAERVRNQDRSSGTYRLQYLKLLRLAAPVCHVDHCVSLFNSVLRNNADVRIETEDVSVIYKSEVEKQVICCEALAISRLLIQEEQEKLKIALRQIGTLHLGPHHLVIENSDICKARSLIKSAGPLKNLRRLCFEGGTPEYLADVLEHAPHIRELKVPVRYVYKSCLSYQEFERIFSNLKFARIFFLEGDCTGIVFLRGMRTFLNNIAMASPKLEAICYTGMVTIYHINDEILALVQELENYLDEFERLHENIDVRTICKILEDVRYMSPHY